MNGRTFVFRPSVHSGQSWTFAPHWTKSGKDIRKWRLYICQALDDFLFIIADAAVGLSDYIIRFYVCRLNVLLHVKQNDTLQYKHLDLQTEANQGNECFHTAREGCDVCPITSYDFDILINMSSALGSLFLSGCLREIERDTERGREINLSFSTGFTLHWTMQIETGAASAAEA